MAGPPPLHPLSVVCRVDKVPTFGADVSVDFGNARLLRLAADSVAGLSGEPAVCTSLHVRSSRATRFLDRVHATCEEAVTVLEALAAAGGAADERRLADEVQGVLMQMQIMLGPAELQVDRILAHLASSVRSGGRFRPGRGRRSRRGTATASRPRRTHGPSLRTRRGIAA